MTFRTLTTATAIAAMFALSGAPAFAASHGMTEDDATDMQDGMNTGDEVQAEGGAETDDGTMTAGTGFTDAQLDAFVTAALDLRAIREDYARQIAEAADEAAAEALVVEAEAEMLAAVEATDDITPEEYMAIGNAAQTDPELAERLTARFEAEMQMPGEDDGGGADDDS